MSKNIKVFKTGLGLDPVSADPASPINGQLQMSDGTVRAEGLWRYSTTSSSWAAVGSGGGGLDVFDTEDFEALSAVNASGNNAAFLGGGTIDGAYAQDSTTEMSGLKSGKYTASSASGNDYIEIKTIDLDLKQRATDIKVRLLADMSGFANDVNVIIYDKTNSTELTDSLDVLTASADRNFYEFSVYVPSTCAQISYGFHMPTAVNTEVFKFDDVEFSTNPFVSAEIMEEINVYGAGNGGTSITANVTDIDFTEVDDSGGNWSGTVFTAPKASTYSFSGGFRLTGASGNSFDIYKNGSNYRMITDALSNTYKKFSIDVELAVGDTISFRSDTGVTLSNDTAAHTLTIHAQASTEHVITPQNNDDIIVVGAGNGGTALTASVTNIDFTEVTDSGNGGGNFNGTQFTAPVSGAYDFSGSIAQTASNSAYMHAYVDTVDKGIVRSGPSTDTKSFAGNIYLNKDEVLSFRVDQAVTLTNSTTRHHININKAGFKTLAAVPVQKIAYIKDIKATTTDGGTFTSGAWQTRDLNTVSGSTEIVSLATNQFTLGAGMYDIQATAPGHKVANHKAKLRNITDSTDDIIGTAEHSYVSTGNFQSESKVGDIITIASSKTFEIQHQCTATRGTDGFGDNAGYSVSEVYTVVKITKLK